MLHSIIKIIVPKLNGCLLLVALTGFVCTHKIQAEEECLGSNVKCYECDSRYDPNCADPFDFSTTINAWSESVDHAQHNQHSHQQHNHHQRQQQQIDLHNAQEIASASQSAVEDSSAQQQQHANATNATSLRRPPPKKLPKAVDCRGCCVKITSKLPDGTSFVKRTCTSNLQINYFMVGLVCMKESGDRGKMCFCETDYCNAAQPLLALSSCTALLVAMMAVVLSISFVVAS